MLEKTLESLLDSKRSNQSILKEVNPEYTGALILWPPDAKSWLIGKDSYSRKDWGQEDKEVTEDEMVGWHLRLNGHEAEQTLGDSEGQEGWHAIIHGFAKTQTQLSDWTTTGADGKYVRIRNNCLINTWFYWGMKMNWRYIEVMVVKHFDCVRCHWFVDFKLINVMLYAFHLNFLKEFMAIALRKR